MINLFVHFISAVWRISVFITVLILTFVFLGSFGVLALVVGFWSYKSYKALEYEPMVVNTDEDPETTEVDYDLTAPYPKRMRQMFRTYFKGFWLAFIIFVLVMTVVNGSIRSFKQVKKWASRQTSSLISRPYPGTLGQHIPELDDSTVEFETTPLKPESDGEADPDSGRWL